MFLEAVWVMTAYVLGSIPFGFLLAKGFCRLDPRSLGSGNIGATNIARTCSKKLGVATLCCDILKGLIAVSVSLKLSESVIFHTMTGVSVVMGHLFSCFLRFKGGKAVATYIGVFIPLAFWQLLLAVVFCALLIWRTGFVSVGSLTLATLVPVFLLFARRFEVMPLALILMALIFWRHKDNIRRLLKGEEKPWRR